MWEEIFKNAQASHQPIKSESLGWGNNCSYFKKIFPMWLKFAARIEIIYIVIWKFVQMIEHFVNA